jgi:hypothetical protein
MAKDTMTRTGKTTLDRLRDEKRLGKQDEVSFDELMKQLEAEGELANVSQLGEGFHLLRGDDDKEKLVGVPFVIMDYVKNLGSKSPWFYTLKIRTATPIYFGKEAYTHFIVNDGGTGIGRQMADWVENGGKGAILCQRGLTVSKDYEVMEKDPITGEKKPVIDPATGKPILGTTFYLDTAL